jgi:hypothetical protein
LLIRYFIFFKDQASALASLLLCEPDGEDMGDKSGHDRLEKVKRKE